MKRELSNCYIVTVTQKVIYDYYDGITYREFKELLSSRGYTIAFEMPFTYEYSVNGEKTTSMEKRLVAYSKRLNMIIVADTFSLCDSFSSVECYCYGMNGFFLEHPLLSYVSANMTVFDLTYSGYKNGPLYAVERLCIPDNDLSWRKLEVPSGWTYADHPHSEEDFAYYERKFLALCPPELKAWFK